MEWGFLPPPPRHMTSNLLPWLQPYVVARHISNQGHSAVSCGVVVLLVGACFLSPAGFASSSHFICASAVASFELPLVSMCTVVFYGLSLRVLISVVVCSLSLVSRACLSLNEGAYFSSAGQLVVPCPICRYICASAVASFELAWCCCACSLLSPLWCCCACSRTCSLLSPPWCCCACCLVSPLWVLPGVLCWPVHVLFNCQLSGHTQ